MPTLPPRSLLFVPGHRDTMLAKAATLPADAIVFDLEDSVPLAEKDAARERVAAALRAWPDNAPQALVRVNPPRAGCLDADLGAVLARDGVGVVVPKVDRPVELAALLEALGAGRELLVNIETPRAVLRAEAFADTPGVTGLFVGGEDLTLALGARRTPAGDELTWARWMVLLAARAAGVAAYDTIQAEFRDLDMLARDCAVAATMGFDGKFAIHPAQLPVINAAFTPTPEELERAQRVVAAYDAAVARGEGAVAVNGQMVDPPVAERARALLARGRPL